MKLLRHERHDHYEIIRQFKKLYLVFHVHLDVPRQIFIHLFQQLTHDTRVTRPKNKKVGRGFTFSLENLTHWLLKEKLCDSSHGRVDQKLKKSWTGPVFIGPDATAEQPDTRKLYPWQYLTINQFHWLGTKLEPKNKRFVLALQNQ